MSDQPDNPHANRARSDSGPSIRIDSSTWFKARLSTIIVAGSVLVSATMIWAKMPSADLITQLDAKHTARADALKEEIDENAQKLRDKIEANAETLERRIDNNSERLNEKIDANSKAVANLGGKVDTLLNIEIEKARRTHDPAMKRAVSEATRKARDPDTNALGLELE